jgi:alanine racemase
MPRPTQAFINLGALRHNCRLALDLSGQGRLMPVVKANAYGHGAVPVARALEAMAGAFAVACIEEAVELRDAGIDIPIMLMEGFFSDEELEQASAHGFWVMLQNDYQLEAILRMRLPEPVCCWIKLDTGMHRLGFAAERAAELHDQLRRCPNVRGDIVLATHLACADDLHNPFTHEQIQAFNNHTAGIAALRSIANSPGLLGWPESRADWNRPGVMLYGQSPFPHAHPEADKLQPVMTLRSEIIALREIGPGDAVGYGGSWVAERASRIATVPVGYGDGYPRRAANGTPVIVNGQRARLAGRVSMDMITVDVTGLPEVKLGDEVTLWGDGLPANEIADHAETIGYEIMTRMLGRVPRIYSD